MANDYFRRVVYTGAHSQLVVMCLQPNEDIGLEVHANVDQFFRIESGEAKVILNGEEHLVEAGDAIVVKAGINHNLINTASDKTLKLYTIYSPANHLDGTIHKTKAAALADETDHV